MEGEKREKREKEKNGGQGERGERGRERETRVEVEVAPLFFSFLFYWSACILPCLSLSTHLFGSALLAREEDVTLLAAEGESARCGGRGFEAAVEDCCCGVVGAEADCFPPPPLLPPPPKPFGLPSLAAAGVTTATRAGVAAWCERPTGGARRGLIAGSTSVERQPEDGRKRVERAKNASQEKKNDFFRPLFPRIFSPQKNPRAPFLGPLH